MRRATTISYWWKCDKLGQEIPNQLVEALEDAANERIAEMMKEGYTSGELCAHIFEDVPGKKTPNDGWECRGRWDTSTYIHSDLVNALERVVATGPAQDSKSTGNAVANGQDTLKRAKKFFNYPKQDSAKAARGGEMKSVETLALVISAPEIFEDPEFMAWLNDKKNIKFTWHHKGAAGDFSDVVVTVDPSLIGDGSECESMPGRIWDQIIEACRNHFTPGASKEHILVRLQNF